MKGLYTLLFAVLFAWSHSAFAQTSTYTFTGAAQTYTVPTGVTSVTVDARGGCGGSASYTYLTTYEPTYYSRGGYGARVVCSLAVTPGQVLNVYVGGNGDTSNWHYTGSTTYSPPDTAHGGWNGGGSSISYDSTYYYYYYYTGTRGAAGGGASDIRTGGTALTNRVIVAGGGGGASWNCSTVNWGRGGDGGSLTGENGYDCNMYYATECGAGGTQSAGGAGATYYGCSNAGTLGIGGSTDTCGTYYYYYYDYGGGGGGGGYYGGGAGAYGGGGGGSSYTDATLATAVVSTRGYNTTRADTVFITVNCSPGIINGVTSICAGFTTTLTDTVSGSSTWSSSNTAVATVNPSTGVVTGVSAGTSTITYSVMAYCGSVYTTATVTVNPLPLPIIGTTGVCIGLTTNLIEAATGGTWSSGSTGIATVVPTSGMVTGAGLGTSVIIYSLPTGCTATTVVTVTSLSTPITGTAVLCGGATTTLSDAVTGGTWSSGNLSVATINVSSGMVTGGNVSVISTAVITYTATGGCSISRVVTVDPQPVPIGGAGSFCAGTTTSLYDAGTGTWSCSPALIATVDPSLGVVTGVAAGTATVSYTLVGGCNATMAVTVNPLPSAITGAASDCPGAIITLSDTTTGGFWVSSNTTVATVDAFSGAVTYILPGNSTISYISGSGCAATAIVTVNMSPLPITGTLTVCAGSSTTLGDPIGPGTWSSGSTSVATVDASGNVYGVSAGTANISYTLGTGCSVSATVTVNPLPFLVVGVSQTCVGLTTSLSDVLTGGTWSTGSSSVSLGATTGSLTGTSAGVAIITYTLPTGCAITKTVTVNTAPAAITGATHVCPGAITPLTDAAGGTWSSGNTAIATVGSTGVVSGITAGTTIISYSIGAGCSTATVVTVNPLPPAPGGIAALCAGSTTALSDWPGAWSSGTGSIATVGGTGIVSGVTGGTANITFTLPTGCYTVRTVTINPLPLPITGTLTLCPGATTSLNDLTTSGYWTSGSSSIATVGLASGIVSGVGPGMSTISFTATGTGCSTTAIVTVNPLPAVIPPAAGICAGATVTLSDATSGGIWSSSPGSSATVTSTGTVNGVTAGTAVISYTLGTGCARTTVVTINPLPTAISGPTAECVGATMLASSTPTGGTWSSTTTSIATIGPTGIITGAATGTTVIIYTTTAGCKALTTITVSLSPTSIIGAPSVCANDTLSLSDAVGGGVWTSSNTAVATIGSLTPVVTGVATGTTTITYSLGTGCTVTKIIAVNPAPSAISGSGSICIGSTIALTSGGGSGAWSSSATVIAPVSLIGVVTGGAAGTSTVSYTLSGTGCSASAVVTVNPTPSAITGTFHVCVGSTTTLGDAITGGTWTSSSTAIASIDPTGIVTGALPGTAAISYSLGAGCLVAKIVTVNPMSAITGNLGICLGATTALADATSGGTWNSGAAAIAPVSVVGVVSGALAGTSVITYTSPAGCATTATVTVNLAPSAISGTLHVCAGAATTLGNTAGGGTWTSGNTAVAMVGSTGVVSGIIHGTSTITYSLGSGCTTTATVTVNPAPDVITGTSNVCPGSTVTLTSGTTGGTWSSAPTATATVSSTGVVTGSSAGTAIVSYTIGSTGSLSGGCATSALVTVNPLPSPVSGGGASVCVGVTTTLTDGTSGGTWNSSNTGVATADPLTGIITGVSPGPATITYTLPTGCSANAGVVINAAPAPISGNESVCIGSITALSDPAAGSGVWSSSNTAIATISAAGIVSGIALGTSTISYSVGGCPATVVVTINSLPGAISGAARVCAGSTTILSDLPDGGTWSSATPGIATVDETSGTVSGVAAGTANIAYSLGAGCTVSTIVTVDAVPSPIAGVTEVCLGYTTPLSDVSAGAWSSGNTGIATITGSGVVRGVAGGPSTISYTNSAGCAATRLVTVVAVPPILGVTNMCAFSATLPLYDSATGGFWTSTLASISSSGVVTPYSAGGVTITYTIPLGCYVTATLTVNPLPGPVVCLSHLCLGSTIPVSDTSFGGVWSSSNTSVVSVSASGIASALSAGAGTISYSMSNGCATVKTVTVDVFPAAGTITGASVVCAGSFIGLSDVATGGAWSAVNTSATVVSTGSLSGGVVSGVSAGTDVISYTLSNSCGTVAASKTVTVNPLPVAGTITGPSNVCTRDSIVLADLAPGGIWSSSTVLATVVGGVVSGLSVGVDTVKYTVTNSCGVAFTTKPVSVNALPDAGTILGIDSICQGITFPLADLAAGGVWSSSNDHISISGTGIINGVSPGWDTVTYAVTNTCGTAATSLAVKVNTAPQAGSITGGTTICSGSKDTLIGSPLGGGWSTSNSNALVTAISTGVVITGVSAGADTIAYTMANECGGAVAIFPVMVYTIEECDSMTGVAASPAPMESETLRVWPNPNDGVFTLLLSSATDEPVKVTITNIVGEKVNGFTTVTNKATEIKLNDAAGVYFVTASTEKGNYVAKVVFAR